jgi:2-polyprenyl-3-methyl-5-hydroxy-6-metoxy-1,4-benzoquinol methylase
MEYIETIPTDHIVNQKYEDYIQPYNQNIFEIIDTRLKIIDDDWHTKKILDFGCNVGHLLGYSNGKVVDYTGVDVQAKPLAIAKERFPHAKWITYDGYHPAFNNTGSEKFPVLKEKYDYIICIGVFTHCDLNQIDKLLNEFRKHLNKGGHIIFSLWERSQWELYSKIFLFKKFNIKLEHEVFKEFNQSIYLINRQYSITDIYKLPIQKCDWIETFYDRNFILTHIPDSRILEGIYTKHTIYMI